MILDDWDQSLRIAVSMLFGYAVLVVLLRISGSRTLAKMNAFDLVITIALGSTLATVGLSSDVSLTEGALAFGVLCGAQYVVAKASIRWPKVESAIKARPQLVLRDGTLLLGALRRARLTPAELRQAVRSHGIGALDDVSAIVLETDGNLSVIPRSSIGSGSALHDVEGRPDRPRDHSVDRTIRVLVVGDSVTALSENELGGQLGWADELDVRATAGLRTDELLADARAGASADPDVGVFLPGYNDILQDETDVGSVEAMMDVAANLPAACWLLIPETIAPAPDLVRAWNQRIEELAAPHDNVTIIGDWRHLVDDSPEFTYLMDLDAVHPNPRGRRALAEVMANAAHAALQ